MYVLHACVCECVCLSRVYVSGMAACVHVMYVCMYIYVRMCVYLFACMYVRLYVCVYVCTFVCLCAGVTMRGCLCVDEYVCIYEACTYWCVCAPNEVYLCAIDCHCRPLRLTMK
jgi:hypothetical protein